MAQLIVTSIAPGVEHEIRYDGITYVLRRDEGDWTVRASDGRTIHVIGKRKKWSVALHLALEFVTARKP